MQTGRGDGSLAFSKASVTNEEADQGDILTTAPVAGGLPRANGRSHLSQFTAVHKALAPVGLTRSAD